MRIWNGNGYDYYGWSGTAGTDVLEDPDLDKKWLNSDMEEVVDSIAASGGFWIKTTESSGTITISGEVPSEATTTVPLSAGFNLVANPYPGDVLVAEFGQLASTMSGPDEEGTFTTELRTWNGNGYDYFGWSGTAGTDVLEDPDLDNKWLNSDMEKTTDKVLFGHAVWIKAGESGSITFTSPTAE